MLDASDPRFYAEDNRPAYLQIHATDPVYWVEAEHTQPFWNVCRHDLIRDVGQDGDLFTTEFWQNTQRRVTDGEMLDVFPYSQELRFGTSRPVRGRLRA